MRRIQELAVLLFFIFSSQSFGNRIPIFLIHGDGPEQIVSLRRLKERFRQSGYPEKDLLLVRYTPNASLDEIKKQLVKQMEDYLIGRPDCDEFDVVAHSLGTFVGLWAVLNSSLSERVRKFISLAGVLRGQNELPIKCRFGRCAPTERMLVPFMNDFLTSFFETHNLKIKKIEFCSLYSNQDGMVMAPPNSAALPGGTNVLIENAKHMSFIRNEDIFNIMLATCYGKFPTHSRFKHAWNLE